MTTEDDFQAALDACPEDHQTRLVFADWLQERGDPRAEGYRALGTIRAVPYYDALHRPKGDKCWWSFAHLRRAGHSLDRHGPCLLPVVWYLKLKPENRLPGWDPHAWCYFPTRREAEDTAALAFAKLPRARRAELLAPPDSASQPDGQTAKPKHGRRKK